MITVVQNQKGGVGKTTTAANLAVCLARRGGRVLCVDCDPQSTLTRQVGIDSRDGFEIGIELTAKAKRLRLPVAEIPTIWLDRQAGVSNFKVARWVPSYVRWYRFAFGPRLTAEQVRERGLDLTGFAREQQKRQGS